MFTPQYLYPLVVLKVNAVSANRWHWLTLWISLCWSALCWVWLMGWLRWQLLVLIKIYLCGSALSGCWPLGFNEAREPERVEGGRDCDKDGGFFWDYFNPVFPKERHTKVSLRGVVKRQINPPFYRAFHCQRLKWADPEEISRSIMYMHAA